MTAPAQRPERALTPDLARGLALLGIALANAPFHLTGTATGPSGRPVEAGPADRVVDAVVGVLVDNRAFPVFTLLFAFGLVVLARRQVEAGAPWPRTRALLLRRCGWLAAFGVLHSLLLFSGDILLSYGLLGVVLVTLLLRAGDRALRWWGALGVVALAAFSVFDGFGSGAEPELSLLPGLPYANHVLLGLVSSVTIVVTSPLVLTAFLAPAVLGLLAAGHGVLERPQEHLPLLRRLTAAGFAVSVLGSVPLVLASLQVVTWPTAADAGAAALHGLTGLAGAVAFVAAVAWWSARRGASSPGPVVGALVAVGRRSLTCYLLQSVIMAPLLAPWGLGWGVGSGTARVSAVALGAYAVTVVVAVALERAGRPGPADAALRRLSRGRPAADVSPLSGRGASAAR